MSFFDTSQAGGTVHGRGHPACWWRHRVILFYSSYFDRYADRPRDNSSGVMHIKWREECLLMCMIGTPRYTCPAPKECMRLCSPFGILPILCSARCPVQEEMFLPHPAKALYMLPLVAKNYFRGKRGSARHPPKGHCFNITKRL